MVVFFVFKFSFVNYSLQQTQDFLKNEDFAEMEIKEKVL